ncbi:MAG: efflux transporter outer membrane subunit [Sphingomonadales bacterium]|nr:efflux transporter outer membrane subunit [Sphingomonadales bacterium]
MLLGSLALAACTPGPRHPVPVLPLPPARPAETIAPASGAPQRLDAGGSVPAEWWRAFGNPALDALVERALQHNADLAAAEATLRQARALAGGVASSQGPQIDASLQSQRARVSNVIASPLADPNATLYTLHTAQLTVAYPLDVFGGGRSKVRSARAAADVAVARLAAARTTVVTNLVQAVIQRASLAAQLAATRDAVAADRELLAFTRERRRIGDAGEADVANAETVLATAEAQVPALERQVRHQQALVGSLVGIPAGAEVPGLPELAELQLPARLPESLPADIVSHRPDVRAAEAQVRGAAADLGTAIAARLPAIQLSASAGGSAQDFASLLAGSNLFFTLAGSVAQPLFHSGQLLHQKRAAEAALAAAQAQYRSAALQAFLDVDDALAGLRSDAAALDAAARQDAAARRALVLARRQMELGAIGRFGLLGIASAASQASVQLVQVRAARMIDSVALFQASGTLSNGGE